MKGEESPSLHDMNHFTAILEESLSYDNVCVGNPNVAIYQVPSSWQVHVWGALNMHLI